jgi:hypothetical protein
MRRRFCVRAIGIDTLALPGAEGDSNICKLIRDGIKPAADMGDFPGPKAP